MKMLKHLAISALLLSSACTWAQSQLRIGLTTADIPLTTGQPDSGFEGTNFTGLTIYDPLIRWNLNPNSKEGQLIPSLASSWKVNEDQPTKWLINLRKDVKFHDGSNFDADSVVWNFDKVLDSKSPQYDPRQSANIRARLPNLATYRKVNQYQIELETKTPDRGGSMALNSFIPKDS